MEVCRLSEPTEVVCELPQSDTGTENGGTTTSGSLESFDVIVSDLTQILCSEDEATVIASAQSVHYYTYTCMSDIQRTVYVCMCYTLLIRY